MRVHGPADIGGADPIRRVESAQRKVIQGTQPASRPDVVEISEMARFLDKLSRLPDIRQEKVEAVRQQIAEGTYLTPERLQKAIDNLIEDLF